MVPLPGFVYLFGLTRDKNAYMEDFYSFYQEGIVWWSHTLGIIFLIGILIPYNFYWFISWLARCWLYCLVLLWCVVWWWGDMHSLEGWMEIKHLTYNLLCTDYSYGFNLTIDSLRKSRPFEFTGASLQEVWGIRRLPYPTLFSWVLHHQCCPIFALFGLN